MKIHKPHFFKKYKSFQPHNQAKINFHDNRACRRLEGKPWIRDEGQVTVSAGGDADAVSDRFGLGHDPLEQLGYRGDIVDQAHALTA